MTLGTTCAYKMGVSKGNCLSLCERNLSCTIVSTDKWLYLKYVVFSVLQSFLCSVVSNFLACFIWSSALNKFLPISKLAMISSVSWEWKNVLYRNSMSWKICVIIHQLNNTNENARRAIKIESKEVIRPVMSINQTTHCLLLINTKMWL